MMEAKYSIGDIIERRTINGIFHMLIEDVAPNGNYGFYYYYRLLETNQTENQFCELVDGSICFNKVA